MTKGEYTDSRKYMLLLPEKSSQEIYLPTHIIFEPFIRATMVE